MKLFPEACRSRSCQVACMLVGAAPWPDLDPVQDSGGAAGPVDTPDTLMHFTRTSYNTAYYTWTHCTSVV